LRVLELALIGVLALTIPQAARSDPVESKIGSAGAGPAPGIVYVWDGNGSTRGGWDRAPIHPGQWTGALRPHWVPNGPPGGWGFYGGPAAPTYWIWGPSGGAFDYPFADWRGPTGGWGNP
jgi:hypothetical protein